MRATRGAEMLHNAVSQNNRTFRTDFRPYICVRVQGFTTPPPPPDTMGPRFPTPPPDTMGQRFHNPPFLPRYHGSGFGSLNSTTQTRPVNFKYGAAAKTLGLCSCVYSLSSDQPKYVVPETRNQNSGPPGQNVCPQIPSSSHRGVREGGCETLDPNPSGGGVRS